LISYTDITPIGGVKVEEFDHFHEFIVTDELARCGSGGVLWGLTGGKHYNKMALFIYFNCKLIE
jgi:hypothetical protein